jgi:Domain of Unknown Function (DUF1080)
MHFRSLLPALLALTISAAQAQDADGFTPMFNGKDLSGWRPVNVAADTFRWEDGMVITTGKPTGFMATEKMYENFIVELEWRHLKEGGNSGVFIWGEGLPAPGVPYARGIEVQVLDLGYEKNKGAWEWFTSHGDIFPIWGATMTPMEPTAKSGSRSFPSEKRVKPSPEWNHYRIECDKGEIKLSVNGKQVTVGKDCVPRKGFLCLESEGSEAHFRNVRIKELPSSNTPAEQTARGYEGFRQLFNGKDLSGWKVTEEIKEVWSVNGLHAVAKAGVKGSNLDLWTEKSYKDFTLVADWKFRTKPVKKMVNKIAPNGEEPVLGADGKPELIEVEEPADSGIYLRGSSKAQVNIWVRPIGSGDIRGYRVDKNLPMDVRTACTPKVNADAKPGQWNRFFITLKGDRCTVVLNEQTIIENAQLPGIAPEGPIALQYHHDEIEFANVFIKEL